MVSKKIIKELIKAAKKVIQASEATDASEGVGERSFGEVVSLAELKETLQKIKKKKPKKLNSFEFTRQEHYHVTSQMDNYGLNPGQCGMVLRLIDMFRKKAFLSGYEKACKDMEDDTKPRPEETF